MKEGERTEVTVDEVKQLYGSSQSLLQIISCTMQDAAYVVRLMCELNVLPLALQITNIAGGSGFKYGLEMYAEKYMRLLECGFFLFAIVMVVQCMIVWSSL